MFLINNRGQQLYHLVAAFDCRIPSWLSQEGLRLIHSCLAYTRCLALLIMSLLHVSQARYDPSTRDRIAGIAAPFPSSRRRYGFPKIPAMQANSASMARVAVGPLCPTQHCVHVEAQMSTNPGYVRLH